MAGEKVKCQLGTTQQYWMEAKGNSSRRKCVCVLGGQGEHPRTEEAWVSHLLQGEAAEGTFTERMDGAFWENG